MSMTPRTQVIGDRVPESPGARRDRAIVANFDSIRQREEFATRLPVSTSIDARVLIDLGARDWFNGSLRMADLYSQTIVLTDAMLLDGCFFLSYGPRRILDALARVDTDPPAITVTGRADSPVGCLRAMATANLRWSLVDAIRGTRGMPQAPDKLSVPKADTLNEEELIQRLAERLATACGPSKSGAGEQLGMSIVKAWLDWFDFIARGQVGFERRATTSEQTSDYWDAARADYPPPAGSFPKSSLSTLEQTLGRSNAMDLEENFSPEQWSRLWPWWQHQYNGLIAWSNRAYWIDFDRPTAGGCRSRRRRNQIALLASATQLLGPMPASEYGVLCYRAREPIEQFMVAKTQPNADRIRHAILASSRTIDLTEERKVATIAMALPVTGIMAGWVLSQLLDRLTPVLLSSFLGLVLGVVFQVLSAWRDLQRLSRSQLRSSLFLPPLREEL